MTQKELLAVIEALSRTAETLQSAVYTSNGIRAALMALAYAISRQPNIDARKFYDDAKYAIEAGHDQDDPVPNSATEFLAQLHDALK